MTDIRNVRVTVDVDCGNAPRKSQVRDWLIALASGDVDTVCSQLDDDVCWVVAGDETYGGISAVRSYVEQAVQQNVTELTIRHLLSHGKQVAAEGGTDVSRFAHVVTYAGHGKSAAIAEIVSYFVPGRG